MAKKIRIQGVDATIKALKGTALRDAMNLQEGLRKCAEIVLKKSQKLVPVETGSLKASGRVVVGSTADGGRRTTATEFASVVYGGRNFNHPKVTVYRGEGEFRRRVGRVPSMRKPSYAWIVHERLDLKHAPPTQARYLADAVIAVRGTMTSVIRRQLKAKIGSLPLFGKHDQGGPERWYGR